MTPPSNNTKTVLRFQLVLDAENVVISTTPKGMIRANITGLKNDQLEKIIDSIADGGPEAVDKFLKLIEEKLIKLQTDVVEVCSKR